MVLDTDKAGMVLAAESSPAQAPIDQSRRSDQGRRAASSRHGDGKRHATHSADHNND
jgi:hypothetical protein